MVELQYFDDTFGYNVISTFSKYEDSTSLIKPFKWGDKIFREKPYEERKIRIFHKSRMINMEFQLIGWKGR